MAPDDKLTFLQVTQEYGYEAAKWYWRRRGFSLANPGWDVKRIDLENALARDAAQRLEGDQSAYARFIKRHDLLPGRF